MNTIYVNRLINETTGVFLFYTIRFGEDALFSGNTLNTYFKPTMKGVYEAIRDQTVFEAPYAVSVILDNTVYYPETEDDWVFLILRAP